MSSGLKVEVVEIEGPTREEIAEELEDSRKWLRRYRGLQLAQVIAWTALTAVAFTGPWFYPIAVALFGAVSLLTTRVSRRTAETRVEMLEMLLELRDAADVAERIGRDLAIATSRPQG